MGGFALASTNRKLIMTKINSYFMKWLLTFLETLYEVIKVKLWPWTQDEPYMRSRVNYSYRQPEGKLKKTHCRSRLFHKAAKGLEDSHL